MAYYTSARGLVLIVQSLLTMPLYQAFYPYIGKAFGETREKGLMIVQKLTPMVLLLTGVACTGMFFIGPTFLVLFYGKHFEPAMVVIRILAYLPVILCISNIYAIQVMLNLKMDKHFFYITIIGAVVSVAFNILMLPRWGYIGSAINCIATELLINISMYTVLYRKGINPLNRKYFSISAIWETVKPITLKLRNR